MLSAIVWSSAVKAQSSTLPSNKIVELGGNPPKFLHEIIAPSNHDIAIGSHFLLDQNCQVTQNDDYTLEKLPEHGTVCYRFEKTRIGFASQSRKNCLNEVVVSNRVYYKSERNYSGADDFILNASRGRKAVDVVNILLTPNDLPYDQYPASPPEIVNHPLELIPKCPDLGS
jgi:hypothetical protein